MTQLNIFHRATQEWLVEARRTAKEKALRDGRVTIIDVLSVCPRPQGVSKKAHSEVFKDGTFRPIGYTRATHPEANGHVIRIWDLKDTFTPITRRSLGNVEHDAGR